MYRIFDLRCGVHIFSCSMWTLSDGTWDSVPWADLLHWGHEVLASGPPGKSRHCFKKEVTMWHGRWVYSKVRKSGWWWEVLGMSWTCVSTQELVGPLMGTCGSQCRPGGLQKMISAWRSGADLVWFRDTHRQKRATISCTGVLWINSWMLHVSSLRSGIT